MSVQETNKKGLNGNKIARTNKIKSPESKIHHVHQYIFRKLNNKNKNLSELLNTTFSQTLLSGKCNLFFIPQTNPATGDYF